MHGAKQIVKWMGLGDRDSRFALDPREQIAAQRWARLRGLEVLGVCHSHPKHLTRTVDLGL